MADAIAVLREDHRRVEKLFKAFEKAGPRAAATKKRLVAQMVKELSVHAAIEEQVFYPTVRAEAEGLDDDVLEALEEHHVVKWELSELDGLSPDKERFDAKVTVMIENVRHHVREEEGELFPAVRRAIPRKRLVEMADQLAAAKRSAPTKPHPLSPQEPPLNVVAGAMAGAVDRAADAVRRATTRA